MLPHWHIPINAGCVVWNRFGFRRQARQRIQRRRAFSANRGVRSNTAD
jgi:hypothetical protein